MLKKFLVSVHAYLAIVSVEKVHFLSLDIVEPLNELHHSTLTTPTGTNEGQCLAHPHTQTNIIEDLHKCNIHTVNQPGKKAPWSKNGHTIGGHTK